MMANYDQTKYKKVSDRSEEELQFVKKKWRHYFDKTDVDSDGVLTREDYRLIAERMIKYNNLEGAAKDRMRKCYMDDFDTFLAGKEKTSYEDIEEVNLYLRRNQEVFHQYMSVAYPKFVTVWFDAIDIDQDGFISPEEYKIFLKCYGYAENDGLDAFKAIDTNHDGQISKEEFMEAAREFFDGVDPNAPGNNFFGPME